MTSLPSKIVIAAAGLALLLASPAEAAKTRKQLTHRKPPAAAAAYGGVIKNYDQNLFMRGPLMFNHVYMGDDPDPFIRSQIWRDLSGRMGGSGN